MPLPFAFDWKAPDYARVFQTRINRLQKIRENPQSLQLLKTYYKDNPADFIDDWGIIFSPKNVEKNLPTTVPFILYPKQREWVEWVMRHWRASTPGLTEKTRQMGFSWLSMALGCTLCLFHEGMVVGIGSRKQEYCDIIGDPKSLLEKARLFMRHLPKEFRGSWNQKQHTRHMNISFPDTGAIMAAEAGDNIGRGNTTSLYFVDESAFLERPTMVEASLSQTTNCRLDISTANGLGNVFAQKRHDGTKPKDYVFTFHWRDDPSKDQAWYDKQCLELDPVTVASEIDINYSASVEGVLIPSAWVQAAVESHFKLGIPPSGMRCCALDIADEGRDLNAFVGAHGIMVEVVEEWSGKGDDIFGTVERAFSLCDQHNYKEIKYDADGLGAGVRGDSRVVNATRATKINIVPYRGSAHVFNPDAYQVGDRQNKDFFANAKAQAWWSLRERFQRTFRWVTEGVKCDPDLIISLPKHLPLSLKLQMELSQPTYLLRLGKIVVDKMPDGARSPNLADALVIRYAETERPMSINPLAVRNVVGHRLSH